MKPYHQLIHALRRAAHKIKTTSQYDWTNATSCNCGMVLAELMPYDQLRQLCDGAGYNDGGLAVVLWRETSWIHGWWGNLTQAMNRYDAGGLTECRVTGRPFSEVVDMLRRFGFENDDWCELEHLGETPYGIGYDNPAKVAAYMLDKANKLAKIRRMIAGKRLARLKQRKAQALAMTAPMEEEQHMELVAVRR